MKTTKTIPTFKNENEEREFWENHDATEYFDTSKVKMVRFPNLKKTTKSISIRLPVDMLDELKVRANSMDVPYQSFIKMLLQEGLMAKKI
ncbi:BrnA antitoxin family protein [bacterium]|nr:BrnA antitoxin family protein [bacterium]MBU1958320.1 BrnA antitoxin family protein [bacterium]